MVKWAERAENQPFIQTDGAVKPALRSRLHRSQVMTREIDDSASRQLFQQYCKEGKSRLPPLWDKLWPFVGAAPMILGINTCGPQGLYQICASFQ